MRQSGLRQAALASVIPLVKAVTYIGTSPGTTECACFDIRTLEVFGGGRIDRCDYPFGRIAYYLPKVHGGLEGTGNFLCGRDDHKSTSHLCAESCTDWLGDVVIADKAHNYSDFMVAPQLWNQHFPDTPASVLLASQQSTVPATPTFKQALAQVDPTPSSGAITSVFRKLPYDESPTAVPSNTIASSASQLSPVEPSDTRSPSAPSIDEVTKDAHTKKPIAPTKGSSSHPPTLTSISTTRSAVSTNNTTTGPLRLPSETPSEVVTPIEATAAQVHNNGTAMSQGSLADHPSIHAVPSKSSSDAVSYTVISGEVTYADAAQRKLQPSAVLPITASIALYTVVLLLI